MISKDKEYTTRDGREVRIYATDGSGEYPIHGAIKRDEGWTVDDWSPDGTWLQSPESHNSLIEKPEVIEGWVNVYPEKEGVDCGAVYRTKSEANKAHVKSWDRIACIHVKFTVGEGLDND